MWGNNCKVRIYNDNDEMYLNVDHVNIHTVSPYTSFTLMKKHFDSYYEIEIHFYGEYSKKYFDFCFFNMKSDEYELDFYYILETLIYKPIIGMKRGMFEITMNIIEQDDIREICPFCEQKGMAKHFTKKDDLYYNKCKLCGKYVYEYE